MTKMTTSEKGLRLIKLFEGLRLNAYLCPAGVPTIGYGHTKGVRMGQSITEAQAEELLKEDLRTPERVLNALGVNFRQDQFDALASWIFNLGEGNFRNSTLRKKILADASDEAICDQIILWVNSNKKPSTGLKKRRISEANLFYGKDLYYLDSKLNIKKAKI